jgi:hypothetical protein
MIIDLEFQCGDEKAYEVTCDNCGYVQTFEAFSFSNLLSQLKEYGWTSYKDVETKEWNNVCSDCSVDKEE